MRFVRDFARLSAQMSAQLATPSDALRGTLAMRGVPEVSIGDAPEGTVVVIKGRVKPTELIEAPLTRRPCVAYHVRIEGRGSFKHRSTSAFHLLRDERDSRDFFVMDDAGDRAIVDCLVVTPHYAVDFSGHTGPLLNDITAKRFLNERDIDVKGLLFDRTTRILEAIVEPGERVTVKGEARWEVDPDALAEPTGYRGTTRPKRLRISGPNGGGVAIRDW